MLLGDLVKINAIKVGKRYLKPKSVDETLSRSCRMVLLEDEGSSLPIGRSGSATLIQFAQNNYVITTRHELGIKPGTEIPTEILETIRIASGTDYLTNIPLNLCQFESSNPDEEFHDLLVFTVDGRSSSVDAPYFYPLKPYSNSERTKSILIGFPTHDDVMEEYIDEHIEGRVGTIHMKVAISDCQLDQKFRSNAIHYRRYINTPSLTIADGYSGGAIFSLIGDLENYEIVLDGIVVRGGNDYMHIIDTNYLTKLLKQTTGG